MTRRTRRPPEVAEVRQEQADRCVACGATTSTAAFEARGLPPHERFFLVRCSDCGMGWTEPRVPEEEIGRWYPPVYYGKENVRFNRAFEWLVRLFRRRRAGVVARHARPGPVLDVGCGRGFILRNLRELGFAPHGIELNEAAAWHARHKLGIPVHVGPLETADLKSESFHAVIFWHSLEHFSRPAEALAHAYRLLRPGGLLVVAVPNSESLQARLFAADWFHLDIPRHYVHFGARALERMLQESGFRTVQRDHFSFEQNPYGWLQSLYNALGLEFNFFYNFLKNRTSRAMPLKKHPVQAAAVLALLPVLLPMSLVMTVVEAAIRRGGTIEFYAVKR